MIYNIPMKTDPQKRNNVAYIDGHNLNLGITKQDPRWKIDYVKFRLYRLEKYGVTTAYYYVGIAYEANRNLYTKL